MAGADETAGVPVRSGLGRAFGQQHGDAVDHGIAAAAPGATQGVSIRRQRLAADRTGEPANIFGLEGHRDKVRGSRFRVQGEGRSKVRWKSR